MADLLVVDISRTPGGCCVSYYHEELTAAVHKIATYPSDRVIYILNRFFEQVIVKEEIGDRLAGCTFVAFEKRRASFLLIQI